MKVEIIVNDKKKGFEKGQVKSSLPISVCKKLIELKIAKEIKGNIENKPDEGLTLKELREKYPELEASNKKKFLIAVQELRNSEPIVEVSEEE